MKTKQLNSVLEFQRELAAREATITGRACVGILTDERDVGSGRVLVKQIGVASYSISKKRNVRSVRVLTLFNSPLLPLDALYITG